ncbi:DUF2103 domain-containing protein [Synechococcus sp. PCC 6312]|uniref:DUF2103 domain-containing protein n=1 Tax=Synechococcus sp. (strain ATCC 27167 / PCC 6312) TaxID=195253 RepID=UPI00029F3A11|nr:DUF2103 domain-containing protein [Synechococcus sp. PCC 6312]AFY62325.1 putative metal-binding protein (DUF2103) [Synechococcus sp. PCC 6312]
MAPGRKKPPPPKGRVVLNHSTHIEGLIATLERLATMDGITTLTPAVISPGGGRSPQLTLRVSVPILGGFKLIARKGTSVQEVFVITSLEKVQLEQAIQQVIHK